MFGYFKYPIFYLRFVRRFLKMIKKGKQLADKDIENAVGGQIVKVDTKVINDEDGLYSGRVIYRILSDTKNEYGKYDLLDVAVDEKKAQELARQYGVSDKITRSIHDVIRPLDSQQQGTN